MNNGSTQTKPAPFESTRTGVLRIVVALDGSPESEAVLPSVRRIAKAVPAAVTFVYAQVPVEDTVSGAMAMSDAGLTPGLVGAVWEAHDDLCRQEIAYLKEKSRAWTEEGIEAGWSAPEMRAAEAIVHTAEETQADVIAMATHGRGGLSRAILGSVADEVMRTAPCAVLLVRSEDKPAANAALAS